MLIPMFSKLFRLNIKEILKIILNKDELEKYTNENINQEKFLNNTSSYDSQILYKNESLLHTYPFFKKDQTPHTSAP